MEPILKEIEERRLTLTHILCTHFHGDHISNNVDYRQRFGCAIGGHPLERDRIGSMDLEVEDGSELSTGGLHIRAFHIPGHTLGQLAFLINDSHLFTGDTLFRGSVGGTCGPGHTTFEDIRHSVMDILMSLPKDTHVYPGHTDTTTIGHEWETNPFIRLWRGLEQPGEEPCTAFGRPAALILRARDYDGGTKCWVRYEAGERDDIVPGSQVRSAVR
jgi:glyoxylase-like metal-dependent hydrolase (beta-lactamase superfamily II)